MWTKAAMIAGTAMMMPATANAAGIVDGGFETQAAGMTNTNGYCYFSGAYNPPACAAGAWTGSGTTSGLQFSGNTAWPGIPTPDGAAYAFIQGYFGQTGSISQTFTVAAGDYVLNWLAGARPGYGGNQSYSVLIDGLLVGGGSTTTGQGFLAQNSNVFSLTGGSHTVTFSALDSSSDNTSFIDAVSMSAVPEPAAWLTMILGFGAIGGMLRSRRRTAKAAIA